MTVRLLRTFRTCLRPSVVGCSLLTLAFSTFFIGFASAEIRIVTGQGQHRLGNYDTKLDAEHFAIEEAKRNALEQVATYLESVTIVQDLNITTDEIRSYTAGLLILLDQQITTHVEQNEVLIHVEIVAQVDSDQVVAAITALRENEDARQQLIALRAELDDLHQELDQANARLATATDPQQIQVLTEQRHDLVDQARSNHLLSQAWTGWTIGGTNAAYAPLVGYAPPQALVIQAWQLAPWNRHIQIAQQKIIPATVLPHYARPIPASPASSGRLQAAIRPWSGFATRQRMGQPPTYAAPGLFPHTHMRPPGSSPSQRFSGTSRSRGNGRGRR